jgi:hypothetical protein
MSGDLRDRAAALAGELLDLKRQVALAGDQQLNQRMKEVTRILRSPRGQFSEAAYERLKERLADELYGAADSEELAVSARKESLTASVRRTVEAEQEAQRTELQARENRAAAREAAVTERERQASPSYRARFAAAGAGAAIVLDVLIRVVA